MTTPQQQTIDGKFPNNNEGWGDWGDWNTENNNGQASQQGYAQNYGHQQMGYGAPDQNFSYGQPPLSNQQQQQQQQFAPPPMMQAHQNAAFPPPPHDATSTYNNQQTFAGYQNYTQPANFAPPPPPAGGNVISDSFAPNDNWNWNVEATPPVQQPPTQSLFPKIPPMAVQNRPQTMDANAEVPPSNFDYASQQSVNYENQQPRLPDIPANTQQQQPKPMPQMARVLKTDTLTPQWSIESQSSDPSMDSENVESRSSNTVTSDEAGNIPSVTTYVENRINYAPPPQQFNYPSMDASKPMTVAPPLVTGEMDQLDAALQAINLGQPSAQQNFQNYYNAPPASSQIYQEQESGLNQQNLPPLPPPPITKETSFSQQEQMFPPQSQIPPPLSQSTVKYPSPVPSPANSNTLQTNSRPSSTPSSASSQFAPPPVAKIGGPPPSGNRSSANPYKRAGVAAHHTLSFQPPTAKPSNDFFQQELPPLDNSELPENLETLAPNNDRNQYLQTGHLSEAGGFSNFAYEMSAENSDHLPPPSASRLVPVGQPEPNNQQVYSNNSLQEPPPGLDRLIPGTELPNASNLNMERQADGQVSSEEPQAQRVFTAPSTTIGAPSNLEIHDRNLYLVAGESNESQQRVIPGVEDEQNSTTNFVQPLTILPMSEQQRELEMDGENLEDQQLVRDEQLIEGENTLDELPPNNQGVGAAIAVGEDSESNVTLDNNKKDAGSIPSTLEDSDRDRRDHHYNNSLSQRRGEEKTRTSKGARNSREKYDSEDSEEESDREKRHFRREGSHRDSRKEPREDEANEEDRKRENMSSRRGDRTRGSRDNRDDDRERRDRDKDRGKSGRDKERRGYDRYGREYRDRDRYETDGSKYETERSSKYEDGRRRENRRGGDDNKRRERRDDRYYEKDDRKRDDHYQSDRKRGDRSRRHDYDDEYQRSSSRNASDRERDYGRSSHDRELREKNRSKYSAAGYYQQPGYGGTSAYDAYAYYQQHQQYFETLRRTNPQAYSEWYRTYYGQMQAAQLQQQQQRDLLSATDGRESVPSGRSSVNEKDRADKLDNQQQRLTPCKFTTSHSMANWQNGLMALVKPRYSSNGFTDVVKIINIGLNDSTRKLFTTYPGPLIRNVTHKKSIIEFCEEQIRQGPMGCAGMKSRGNSLSSLHTAGNVNRGSFTLIWDYLILLLRQNGTFVGTDISELLMKNKLEYPYDTPVDTQNQSSRRTSVDHKGPADELEVDKPVVDEDNELSDDDVKNDDTTDEDVEDLSKEKSQLSEKEITDKFRNYLLYGNIADALEWATDNNLWGHALFLASKVDRRQHANVMMKFANKLTLNDPLQTLYQLMSGRSPNSVTSIVDEKWGDWRPHLAMILSNTSEKVDLSRKAITILGDSLYNRGDLFGAQFCYLVADISFGKWSNVNQETATISNTSNAIRLVLLGSSQHKCFREFATNESIVMTEIYEYARTLNEEKFTISDLQPYKYLLATRMLDYGQQLKSLLYMEQIALKIQRDPLVYEPSFIQKIYALGDRLKYFDPVIEKIIDESILDNNNSITGNIYQSVEDQKWLQDLANVLRQYNSGALTYEPISIQNSMADQSVATSSVVDSKSQIDKQFVEISNQFSELSMQYENPYSVPDQTVGTPVAAAAPVPMYGGDGQSYEQQAVYQEQQPLFYGQQQQATEPQQQPYDMNYGQNDYNNYSGDQHQQQQQQGQSQVDGYGQTMQPSYDAWNAPSSELPKPSISMPNSMSNKSGFYDDDPSRGDGGSGNKENDKSSKSTGNDAKKQVATKEIGKIGVNGPNSSGWFGGIFNKFSLKPKNQMILPDDKNPSILWDSDKKKWVNTDGVEEEQESFKPPPKMSQIPAMQQQMQPPPQTPPAEQYQQQQQPPQFPMGNSQMPTARRPSLSASGAGQQPLMSTAGPANGTSEAPKVPNLQSNMLRMQRKRTLKNSYVDVFNPSGAPSKPIEPILAPALPQSTQIPSQGYFTPAPAAAPSEQQPDGAPQFYNPNQYGGYQQ